MTEITTKPKPATGGGQGLLPPRHIVENLNFDPKDPNAPFVPAETTLCGKSWDRFNVKHNGQICQACVDEQRRRHRG